MFINKIKAIGILLFGALFVASCSESSINSPTSGNESPAIEDQKSSTNATLDARDIDLDDVRSMEDINQQLAEEGVNVRLSYAETITKADGPNQATGQTIVADDRQKRLESQWVSGDERRMAEGNKLTYLIDQTWNPANFGTENEVDGNPAIDASFDTWNSVKKNAKLEIVKREDTGEQPSAFFVGGNPFLADISVIGFMPGILLDLLLGPGASDSVLGVTFTFNFVDDDGNPTDINNDGYADVAYKEVWYNDSFLWTDDADGNGTDIETVALHENGHALGFGHFGKIFITGNNNKLHVSPRSVMNAVILGTQRDLLGTDKASYKNIYGSWPKK